MPTVLQESQKSRVRVWRSYRTSRSSGYGHGSLAEVPEVPGIGAQATSRTSGYGYERPTEITEVLRGVIPGVNTYPGMVCRYPTEHNLVNACFSIRY